MNNFVTVYELLGLIKDGKAPKKIKCYGCVWKFDKKSTDYFNGNIYLIEGEFVASVKDYLQEPVEILEDKPIIEKLNIENDSSTHFYITNEYGTKCGLTKHSKIIADKLNQVIDYINRKEDK